MQGPASGTCYWCSTKPMVSIYRSEISGNVGFEPCRATHANVLVTRTFSKIYGLAAERVLAGPRVRRRID